MGCDRRETSWRRQVMRSPVEGQGHGPKQSNPRTETGSQFPGGSKERRETGARGRQGRVLVRHRASVRVCCRGGFSPPLSFFCIFFLLLYFCRGAPPPRLLPRPLASWFALISNKAQHPTLQSD